jgi:hypothetical protein
MAPSRSSSDIAIATILQFPSELLLDIDTLEDYERALKLIDSGR